MRILSSIISNKFFDFYAHLTILIRFVLQVMLRDLPDNAVYDEYEVMKLKDFAGELLHFIIKRTADKAPQVRG